MNPWLKWITLIVATIVAGCQPRVTDVVISGHTMGTSYTVRVARCPITECEMHLQSRVDQRLEELNGIFSHYDPGSALSAFNAQLRTDWQPVPRELAELTMLALRISRQSNGAFDVTVAPAVDAWGFGSAQTVTPPDQSRLANLREQISFQQLEARTQPPALRKAIPELRVDMSAIAKGYAVDQLSYLLEAESINDYLVEIGGELRTSGVRDDGQPWRIGIEPPDIDKKTRPVIEFVVSPGNMAVASSGDYRNYYMQGDRRISHLIDPQTAAPVANKTAAVSIIAPSAAQADALATALLVMGPEAGLAWAERDSIAALFTTRENGRLRTQVSTAFAAYLLKK